jgi:hypothetical protein
MTALRNFLALVVGLFLGGLVNMGLVTAGPAVFPLPAGIDVTKPESLAASIHLFEPRNFVFPFLAHALGTFVGAFVAHAAAASRRWLFAWIVGVVFLGGGIAAARMIPAPGWFVALDLVAGYIPMAWFGGTLASRLRPESPGA